MPGNLRLFQKVNQIRQLVKNEFYLKQIKEKFNKDLPDFILRHDPPHMPQWSVFLPEFKTPSQPLML